MKQNVINQQQEITEKQHLPDPNIQQRRAADPEKSVWVGASAGTGKTKVLVDRVLRLLLPQENGQPATEPHRILCLTFTKAAASEMALRISKTLGSWAVMDEDDKTDRDGQTVKGLRRILHDLTGREPDAEDISAARRLFAQVVDTPGGLKIMTIHSFCQSVLGRFPLEAGLSPHFQATDDRQAAEMLSQAMRRTLARAALEKGTALHRALDHLAMIQNEDQFRNTLKALCGERLQLKRCIREEGIPVNAEERFRALYERLCRLQGIEKPHPPEQLDDFVRQACRDGNLPLATLWQIAKSLLTFGGKRDTEAGQTIQSWLEKDTEERFADFAAYRGVFVKKGGTIVKNIPCKAVQENDPDCASHIEQEALRLLELGERWNAMRSAMFTAHLLVLGGAILDEYEAMKTAQAILDYDDLIDYTSRLLTQNGQATWIMYKLDGGLDHILIDEAQDTNPEQWQIIDALTDDFFSGRNTREDMVRTVFTVGDEKQSIYSFQRAAPAEFDRMQKRFADKVSRARLSWHTESLNMSFRSAPSVLKLVDAAFADPETRQGLGAVPLKHISYRQGEEGLAELWPLFTPPETQEEENWTLPVTCRDAASAQAQTADYIAGRIAGWLNEKEILASKGRPVEPGDIMILVRSRSTLVSRIVRALKKRNIPVSGIDRMVLGEQLAVKDILAAAQFALLPEDDLTLACLLKSPLLGWDDDRLYNVAINRQNRSLWQAVRDTADEKTVDWLSGLIKTARQAAPYEFISGVLQRPCPADAVSGLRAIRSRLGDDVLDPLDELQNAALAFERDHIPGLQAFLFRFASNDIEIKREMEESGNRVRIMTVHGSKGLQAPIVIMPDTTRVSASKKTPQLLWPDKSGLPLPLWSPKAEYYSNSFTEARSQVETRLDEEYRRLLYVAMTRAEDRLYIGGYKTKKTPIAESWYNYVAGAFAKLDNVTEITDKNGNLIKQIKNPQTKPVKQKEAVQAAGSGTENPATELLPAWLYSPPPQEPVPPRPLMPSKPAETGPAVYSPLGGQDDYRFRRGNMTHKLLQFLPDLPAEQRQEAANAFAAQKSHDELPDNIKKEIVRETMAIINHRDYAPLFAGGSMAEVPVTGMSADGTLISGQIDRLLVTAEEIWIVDYKTDRPPPKDESGIPARYRQQLKSYSDIVSKIYTARKVRCFLLWTDGPALMEVAAGSA